MGAGLGTLVAGGTMFAGLGCWRGAAVGHLSGLFSYLGISACVCCRLPGDVCGRAYNALVQFDQRV